MEDDAAAGAGGEEGLVVGDVAVSELETAAVGRQREGGEVAGRPDKCSNGVAGFEEGVAEPPAQVT